jgi:hypothetical protein
MIIILTNQIWNLVTNLTILKWFIRTILLDTRFITSQYNFENQWYNRSDIDMKVILDRIHWISRTDMNFVDKTWTVPKFDIFMNSHICSSFPKSLYFLHFSTFGDEICRRKLKRNDWCWKEISERMNERMNDNILEEQNQGMTQEIDLNPRGLASKMRIMRCNQWINESVNQSIIQAWNHAIMESSTHPIIVQSIDEIICSWLTSKFKLNGCVLPRIAWNESFSGIITFEL